MKYKRTKHSTKEKENERDGKSRRLISMVDLVSVIGSKRFTSDSGTSGDRSYRYLNESKGEREYTTIVSYTMELKHQLPSRQKSIYIYNHTVFLSFFLTSTFILYHNISFYSLACPQHHILVRTW